MNSILKRLLDLVLVVLSSPFSVPLVTAGIICIAVTERQNPIFSQTRLGKNAKPFRLFKLRTMSYGTGDLPTHQVNQNQITKSGAFLRRTKLDEIPQLWNVLCGQMSLVGPRPCLTHQKQLIEERQKYSVFSVKPGITGLAQVEGIDMSKPIELAKADARYVNNITLLGDIKIIAHTLLGRGTGDPATRN